MTGPEGERAGGWWRITDIQAPNRLEFDDGFADENGEPVEAMGTTHASVMLEDMGGRMRMTVRSVFESEEQMDKMLEMGMEEGMQEAAGQIDGILAEHSHA
jgi:uncharacterized protein YndB with AHSA1/START domain